MDTFSALAEPTRRTIVEMLARNDPLAATEISAQFPVSPPAISQHLKVLREAKLVLMEKQGQQRMYQLNPDSMFELEAWARHMTLLWNQRFDALEKVLEAENGGGPELKPGSSRRAPGIIERSNHDGR